MKKLTVLFAAIVLLTGCGSSDKEVKTGSAQSAKDENGDYASAEVTMKGDQIEEIKLDEMKNGTSKKALGSAYNMKSESKINKEWDEQVVFLENYIEKKGLDQLTLDEKGYAKNDDVLSGCTINLKTLMETANEALKNAK